jgi:hypothetical protein
MLSEVYLNLMKIDLLCCSLKSARNIKVDHPVSAAGRETVAILAAHLHTVAVIYPVSNIPLACVSFPSAAHQFIHHLTLGLHHVFFIHAHAIICFLNLKKRGF